MAKLISIGQANGKKIGFDLDVLLSSRLLIQASSGAGKSWTLRRIVEQAFGQVQIILIDPEGEFSTLREKFDFVLVGTGGDVPVSVKSADLLAHKLLELHASAVCDIFELKPRERHQWVAAFLNALVDAPKKLWHPVLVIVDEAHVYCPEKGAGESEASEAMISLATRGRKRGFAAIFATQRLGKLRKDAAAELTNVLIGRTWLDVDRKRAVESLGIARAGERTFQERIKVLKNGEFFALGRAISTEIVCVQVGAIETAHEVVEGKTATPPPTDRVKQILSKLASLPVEAEKKALAIEDLQHEIRSLKAQLSARPRSEPVPPAEPPWPDQRTEVESLRRLITLADQRIKKAIQTSENLKADLENIPVVADLSLVKAAPPSMVAPAAVASKVAKVSSRTTARISGGPGERLPIGEKAVLIAAAQYDGGVERDQLSVLTGYKRSSRDAYVQRLRERGYVDTGNGSIVATQEGIAALGNDYEPLPTGEELQAYWRNRLPEGERKILNVLIREYPSAIDRDSLDEETGYKRSSRDAYLQRLSSRRLVETVGRGEVRAVSNLF